MTVPPVWRRLGASAPLMLAVLLAACGSTPKEDENSPQAIDKLYAEAKSDLDTGGYDAAAKAFEKVEGRSAGTMMAQQAGLDLAYAYYKGGEKADALSTLDRFIKLHPSSPAYDYALYLRGLINYNGDDGWLSHVSGQDMSERDQQAARDAYQSFKQLVDTYPNSRYAPDARTRIDNIVNALASYELHVARYYYRRGAYLAAANRAQQQITDFQQSPSTEEALYIMAQSYDKLGLDKLRDDANRVLDLNYPHSRFRTTGISKPNRAWWQVW